ncbi:MAG TPA: GAF domain-containing protein [Solirubrobacteraceae bacterium]
MARGVPAAELFRAVTEEVGRVLSVENVHLLRYGPDDAASVLASFGRTYGVLPAGARMELGGRNVTTLVLETGRSARIDDYGDASGPLAVGAREHGVRSSVAAPVVVEASLWGVMVVGSSDEQALPAETEARLGSFTELVATAIANAASRDELARLAEQQAALRRVATLVARGPSPEEVFLAVTDEIGRLLAADMSHMVRYEADGTFTVIARAGVRTHFPVGSRWPLGAKDTLTAIIFETGRPGRVNNYADFTGPLADEVRAGGVRSSVAAPIIVEGRVWGLVGVSSLREEPPPADSEARLASFTELVATAIANAESHAGLAQLAEQQEALRRVATLVARGVPPEEVFASVTEEVNRLFLSDVSNLCRLESDGTFTILASARERFPVGSRWSVGGKNVTTLVFETGRPGRIDNFVYTGPLADDIRGEIRSAVGAPIIVEGHLWGALNLGRTTREPPLPPDTEARLADFTELVAMAVANAESRAGLARLGEEQAALRRIATFVARGVPPEQVFALVTEEVERLFLAEAANLARFESDGTFTVVASAKGQLPVGSRLPFGGRNIATVLFETGRPCRLENVIPTGPLADHIREAGVSSAVGTPVIVEGHLWGGLSVGSTRDALPPDTEARLSSFTELVATAIANADTRAALAASRARIVAAADESRRRIERDLHDGAQQRLVHTVIVQQLALRALKNGDANVGELMAEALQHAEQANYELSELAHGILPSVLTREGLRAGVKALVSRMSLPVSMDVAVERLPAGVEATAYFVVSEALTNVVKHAHADRAAVMARVDRGVLEIEIRDEGVGGAHVPGSTGLHGLEDRVSALDGQLVVESPPGRGTRVYAELPLVGQG